MYKTKARSKFSCIYDNMEKLFISCHETDITVSCAAGKIQF